MIAELIESELEHPRDMYAILSQARPNPQVLDDATLARVKRQFREQLDHVADYEWQLERWRERKKLSGSQRAEVNRLAGDLEPLRAVTRMVLDLAAELRARHDRRDPAHGQRRARPQNTTRAAPATLTAASRASCLRSGGPRKPHGRAADPCEHGADWAPGPGRPDPLRR